MARTIEKTLYRFEELSNAAKERAREWWRSCEHADESYSESVIYDVEQIADILGVRFRSHDVRLMNGNSRAEPNIYWSGFCSQGDGACFEGTYLYEKDAAKKIRKYDPLDADLHKIADDLQSAQRRYFYRLRANVTHRDSHYSHEYTTSIEVTDPETYRRVSDAVQKDITTALRSFMRWIYRQLEQAYEYAMSDENVDECITLNEYEFDECGHIA